ATARAVASMGLLCELCLPYVRVGGRFLAMKSVDSAEEVLAAAPAVDKLGGALLPPVQYQIPGSQVSHRVVQVEKMSATPTGYPRRWAKMQKSPLS
ncbi:MAG: class I SAM-dependent methyltransferase, partial [Oscillospiraceae bacterium]|nr:class I SAM-dependent methyltransferase [Oscillospiraceae bacterium]